MTAITRRAVLTGAAASANGAGHPFARSRRPRRPTGKQAPGFYRYKVRDA